MNHIDLDAAKCKGIIVTNVPGGNSESVAELTIALIFAVARQIVQSHLSVREGKWQRFYGMEIQGKTLGLLGFGRIGRAVARRAVGLGCTAIAYDPYPDCETAQKLGVEFTEFETVIRSADILSLHLPLVPKTTKILDFKRLSMMKPGSILINTSRGGVIDEAALAEVLKRGHLAGAGVDVYASEPPADSPLIQLDNVVTLSHIGAYSLEALERVGMTAARSVAAVLTGEQPDNVVCL